jgi:uncharacterized membrane protein
MADKRKNDSLHRQNRTLTLEAAKWFYEEAKTRHRERVKERRNWLITHAVFSTLFLTFAWILFGNLTSQYGPPPMGPPVILWVIVTIGLAMLFGWHLVRHVRSQNQSEIQLEQTHRQLLDRVGRRRDDEPYVAVQDEIDYRHLEDEYLDNSDGEIAYYESNNRNHASR